MQQMSSKHAAKFHAGNFQSANFLFVQLISVQVISCAANLPSVQLISVQVISRAGNCMQVIGSSKSDSGNFHAVKLSLPNRHVFVYLMDWWYWCFVNVTYLFTIKIVFLLTLKDCHFFILQGSHLKPFEAATSIKGDLQSCVGEHSASKLYKSRLQIVYVPCLWGTTYTIWYWTRRIRVYREIPSLFFRSPEDSISKTGDWEWEQWCDALHYRDKKSLGISRYAFPDPK